MSAKSWAVSSLGCGVGTASSSTTIAGVSSASALGGAESSCPGVAEPFSSSSSSSSVLVSTFEASGALGGSWFATSAGASGFGEVGSGLLGAD
jgi:hypothetical protein